MNRSLPTYLEEQAYLHRLEQARLKTQNSGKDALRWGSYTARVFKAYGGFEQYEAEKRRVGIAPEHVANFERYGVVLQPKQLEFAVWARRCDAPNGPSEIGFGGARGPGKSFALLAQAGLDDCQRFPGLKGLYLRKIGKSAKEQLQDLTLALFGEFEDKEVQNERILFGNGSRILIGGFKDDAEALKYQGVEYDFLIIEEGTQLTERTYKILRLSERSSKSFNGVTFRPRTYASFNPLGIGHQFVKKRFVDPERKGGQPERKFIFATVDDNVFVNPEYVKNLDDLTGVEYRAYRKGEWDISAGAYFEEWRYERHVIAPLNDLSWMRDVWCSMDYGFQHWNVIYLHAQDGDGNIYTLDELAHRRHYPAEIAPDVHQWLGRYGLKRNDLQSFLVGTDVFSQTGTAQLTIAQQYEAQGIPMSPAETAPGSRIARAHDLSKRLGNAERGILPTWFVTTRCRGLIECIPYLERNPNNAEDVLKVDADEHGVGGDDWYDGATYGLYRPHTSSMS